MHFPTLANKLIAPLLICDGNCSAATMYKQTNPPLTRTLLRNTRTNITMDSSVIENQ